MPHIELGNDQPGIRSLFFFRPETAAPLCELVEVLLRGPSTLERWERELIATRVSGLNECRYCTRPTPRSPARNFRRTWSSTWYEPM
jgi:alkylhydroperoxidase family enzyme